MRRRTIRRVLAFLTGSCLLLAGGPAIAGQPARTPPRVDPLTASIQGRVTTADSGAPIRRAEVRAIAVSGFTRMATTDGDGRFTLRAMPAGEYRLHVSRSGFVPLEYGQRRPFEAAVRIPLEEGGRVTANVALPRGAAIVGRVIDEAGEPLAGVRLQALRVRTVEGRRRLLPVGPADVSDDTGAFRVYGLPPGDYYVVATPPEAHLPEVPRGALPNDMPPGASFNVRSTNTTFYPGTANIQEALRITVGVGGDARADMQLGPTRAAVVSGIVLDSSGAPLPDALISLRSELVAMGVSAIASGPPPLAITGHAGADGTFELRDVPAGPYSLHVSGPGTSFRVLETGGEPKISMGEFAEMAVVVGNGDLTGLTVTTGQGGAIEATIVADAGVARPLPTGLEVGARTLSPGGPHMSMRNANSGTFRIMVSGPAHLQVNGLPDDWAVKAILVNGVEATDQPIQPRAGTTSVRVVLTDRITEVVGRLSPPAPDAPDSDRRYSVVVFPADPSRWTFPSRFLRTVKTDAQGAFRLTGLPGNERYLAVAVDYLEDGEGTDPEFLERIQDRATSFTLGETERRTLALPLVER